MQDPPPEDPSVNSGETARNRTLHWANKLLDCISHAQSEFIAQASTRQVFENLLADLLQLTDSGYGFIGEVLHSPAGKPYLKTQAVTNIAWNEATQKFYAENAPRGLEFHNLKTLFGRVLTSGKPIIANDPSHDPRRGGLPHGHPPLNAFLGLPFYRGTVLMGMVGIANRPGGYDEQLVRDLQPFLATCANLIEAHRSYRGHQETQQAQRESESRLRAVLDTVADAIITIDEHGIVESVNRAVTTLFGYTDNEIVGKNVNLLMPEAFRGKHDGHLARFRASPQQRSSPLTREVPGRRKDGTVLALELSISQVRVGDKRLITGILRDISERQAAARALADSNNLRQAILDSANVSIIATDTDGVIRTFNRGAERMLGYGATELVGRATPAVIHDPEEVVQRARELSRELGRPVAPGFDVFVLKAGEGAGEERMWTYIRKDGSRLPVLLSVSTLRRSDASIAGYVGIGTDMTERERMSQLKNDFISTVSHELRTPLTSIRGSLGLINGGAMGEVPAKMHPLIDIALKNAERLSLLINDILDIEKIEAGKMRFDSKNQPLGPIIEHAIEANKAYAAQHGVLLELIQDAPEALAYFDANRILQVLANLLSNAAKFSPQGSTVRVRSQREGDNLRVSITDQGPGIPADFQDRIFQKFAQSDSSSTRQKGGTGLGLAICRAIMEKHHGHIGFDTGPHGTTFFFLLPEEKTAAPDPALDQGLESALLCSRQSALESTLAPTLLTAGFSIDRAAEVHQTKLRLEAKHYAGAILDITATDPIVAAQLRLLLSSEASAGQPMILLTERGGVLGLQGWLSKPVDPARLRQRLSQAAGPSARNGARVLHVEDDPDMVKIVEALMQDVARTTHAGTVADARQRIGERSYDVILLDINLPDGSGLELIPQISALAVPTPVILFSAFEASDQVLRSVSAALLRSRAPRDQLANTVATLLQRTAGRDHGEPKSLR